MKFLRSVALTLFACLCLVGSGYALNKTSILMLEATGTPSASTFLRGDGAWAQSIPDADKGDITASSAGATWTIDNSVISTAKIVDDAVTFDKLQNIASDRLLGRDTASSGNTEELTVGGGLEFSGAAGIQRSALTGDVTATAGSNSTTVANDAVTNAKAANMAANTLKGRRTSSGDPEDIAVGDLSVEGSPAAGMYAPIWDASGVLKKVDIGDLGGGGGGSLATGFLYGLVLSNNSTDANNDIDVASGSARAIEGDDDIVLGSGITKRLDAAWAVGSGNGGLDTGSKANSTGYHVWAIKRSDTGVVDALFSTSATSPSMPTNYDKKRRIGSIITDGSGNIRGFIQHGSLFEMKVPYTFTSGDIHDTVPQLKTVGVPLGVKLGVQMFLSVTASTAGYIQVFDPDIGALTTVVGWARYYAPASTVVGQSFEAVTNASGQLYMRSTATTTISSTCVIMGWRDLRDTSI